jgi:hypothetical protein
MALQIEGRGWLVILLLSLRVNTLRTGLDYFHMS